MKYFVSYTFISDNSNNGYGDATITTDRKIKSIEDIDSLKDLIKGHNKKEFKNMKPVILFFKELE